MNLRPVIFFFLCFAFLASGFNANAQRIDSINQRKDTVIKKRDTTKKNNRDTATLPNFISQKPAKKDSSKATNNPVKKDVGTVKDNRSIPIPATDTANTGEIVPESDTSVITDPKEMSSSGAILANTNKITDRVLAANTFINTKDHGTYFLQELRTFSGKEFTFYLLCILLFILALFKTFYPMYFNNLFRIFFNTSLRQTQLTDQLSQAKFPSFVLNIFFTLSGGVYLWLLFTHFNKIQSINPQTLLIICILSLVTIYLTKFIILKFTGWLAGIQQTTDNYIFVIFLVNKIMGVLLIPFVILLAFSMQEWISFIGVISALFIGLLLLSRYAKSYGALEKKLNINSFHLFIFVVGAEIIPLFIFYKIAVDYLV
jgi:hypothetical protein